MPIIEGLEQYTADWFQMRKGMVTASKVDCVMSYLSRKSKNGGVGDESAARRTYKWEVVVETLTNELLPNYVSPAMEWGTEMEPVARSAYEIETGLEPQPIGFAIHDAIGRFGASPDSLVSADGLLEIKCPMSHTHLEYFIAGVVPEQYKPQMTAEMLCTNRTWCDFVSYDPRMPKHLQLFIRRHHLDEKYAREMESEVCKFLAEVDEILLRLKDGGSLVPALEASLEVVK